MAKAKQSPEEDKNPVGRPRKELDVKLAISLCKIQCTASEICAVLEMCEDTLSLRLKELGYSNFSDFYERYADEGKISLRRYQFTAASRGNSVMLKWLGQQYLGQTDKREITGADGGPLRSHVTTVEAKPYEDMTLEELQAELHARSAGS
jgi:hypothetical protein